MGGVVEFKIAIIFSTAEETVSWLQPTHMTKLTISRDPQQTLVVRTDIKPRWRGFMTGANLLIGIIQLIRRGVEYFISHTAAWSLSSRGMGRMRKSE